MLNFVHHTSPFLLVTTLCFAWVAEAGPLQDAAVSGDDSTVKQLLDGGAEPDEQGVATPLYFASQRGHVDVAAVLIESGADVNSLSKWGGPLHVAAKQGHVEIVELLLQNGADPNLHGGEDHGTPLHFAAYGGSLETIAILLKHGADVNARGRWQEPPIHVAVMRGKTEAAALLLESGARPVKVRPIGAELASADLEVGRVAALRCTECHTFEPGKTGARGPSLWNVVGRPKASVDNFPYTPAMAAEGGIWDYEALNQFLADSPGTVPGTLMYFFGGQADRTKRIALIAYLRTQADEPMPLPE